MIYHFRHVEVLVSSHGLDSFQQEWETIGLGKDGAKTETEKFNQKTLWLLGSVAAGLFAEAESAKHFEKSGGLLSNRWLVWR